MAADFSGRSEQDGEGDYGIYSVPLSVDTSAQIEPVRLMAQSVPAQTMSGGQPV